VLLSDRDLRAEIGADRLGIDPAMSTCFSSIEKNDHDLKKFRSSRG
jgi:hypothetical protein